MKLETPHFEKGRALLVAGLKRHFTTATVCEIPALWRKLVPYFGKVPMRTGRIGYGVVWNMGPERAWIISPDSR